MQYQLWMCAKSLIELSDRSSIVGSSVSAQASSSGVRYPKPIGHNLPGHEPRKREQLAKNKPGGKRAAFNMV
jgi:hypothetical protein